MKTCSSSLLTTWLKSQDPELLQYLLSAATPEEIKAITEKSSSYIEKFCVVFLDLSGFSKATKTHGDFDALRLVLVAETLIDELADENNGHLVKSIGDSWLLKFKKTQDAVMFMGSLYGGLSEINKRNSTHLSVIPCGGLAYGPLLKFGEQDILGKTVNTAAVAGEDTAGAWEILVAESALAEVDFDGDLEPTDHVIGGEAIFSWTPVAQGSAN